MKQSPSKPALLTNRPEISYKTFPAKNVTDDLCKQISTLFSTNYGIWLQTLKRVKLGPRKIREMYLNDNDDTFAVVAMMGIF